MDATCSRLLDPGRLFFRSYIENQQIDVNKTFENKIYQLACSIMVMPMVYPREKFELNSLALG